MRLLYGVARMRLLLPADPRVAVPGIRIIARNLSAEMSEIARNAGGTEDRARDDSGRIAGRS